MNLSFGYKKYLFCFLSLQLLIGFIRPVSADTFSMPTLVSFTMSPNSIELASPNTLVTFDLTINNPTGISNTQTIATLSNSGNFSLTTSLTRTDVPIDPTLQTVKFHGTLLLPSNIPAGIYTATAAPITGLNANGTFGYPTSKLNATTTTSLIGALNSLLVRVNGNLNYSYPTFTGPTFNNVAGSNFTNPAYNNVQAPIWKVGEIFDPTYYYQLNVPTLALKIKSNTPSICTSNGKTLIPVSVGSCSYTVYTDQTLDYQYNHDEEVVLITAARIKPVYSVGTIPTQSSASLPLTIAGPTVFTTSGIVLPVSATPSICFASGTFITIVSGGICTINYSTPASTSFLASDVFPLTFQITRSSQSIAFTTPTSIDLSAKVATLSATASSGLEVTFKTTTPSICSANGNSLKLLALGTCGVEADQAGSTTISPASATGSILVTGVTSPAAKKIACVKKGKSRTFVGAKCPAGYKPKK